MGEGSMPNIVHEDGCFHGFRLTIEDEDSFL